MAKYLVVIEKHADNFNAYVPNVPGVFGIGNTAEEVVEDVQAALQLWVEGTIEQGGTVPESTFTQAVFVEVDVPAVASQAS